MICGIFGNVVPEGVFKCFVDLRFGSNCCERGYDGDVDTVHGRQGDGGAGHVKWGVRRGGDS